MDNKTASRLQQLEFLLKQCNELHLREAAKILNVSEMTLRRDLQNPSATLMLLGGYLVRKSDSINGRYQILEQETKHLSEKMQVGQKAAELVKENDIIFFDCGSTVPFIASQIDNTIPFTALCCSLNTFLILNEKPNCHVILCGGHYSRHNSFFIPLQTHNELDLICTTKAFISTAGVDTQFGATCFDLVEAQIKRKAMAKTQQAILVFDHTKLHQVKQAYIGSLSEFDLLVCDQQLSHQLALEPHQIL